MGEILRFNEGRTAENRETFKYKIYLIYKIWQKRLRSGQ